jgi:hypothetical protein
MKRYEGKKVVIIGGTSGMGALRRRCSSMEARALWCVWDRTLGGFGSAHWDFPSANLLPKSRPSPICCVTGRSTERRLTPGTPRAYLQRLLSRAVIALRHGIGRIA